MSGSCKIEEGREAGAASTLQLITGNFRSARGVEKSGCLNCCLTRRLTYSQIRLLLKDRSPLPIAMTARAVALSYIFKCDAHLPTATSTPSHDLRTQPPYAIWCESFHTILFVESQRARGPGAVREAAWKATVRGIAYIPVNDRCRGSL